MDLVDPETLDAYDRGAGAFAEDWEEQPPPTDLYELVNEHFAPGPTADVGCGSGRDTAWLHEHGFPSTGYDASEGLLSQARRRHPAITFNLAALPDLEDVPRRAFQNVLCETVIMHLERRYLGDAVRNLSTLLIPGGVLYLSWRVSTEDSRDDHGRLYAAVDHSLVLMSLGGMSILHDLESTSASSGKTIHRVIARLE